MFYNGPEFRTRIEAVVATCNPGVTYSWGPDPNLVGFEFMWRIDNFMIHTASEGGATTPTFDVWITRNSTGGGNIYLKKGAEQTNGFRREIINKTAPIYLYNGDRINHLGTGSTNYLHISYQFFEEL